jgi:hypothetical protein
MPSPIFNSLLYGELRPCMFRLSDMRRYVPQIRSSRRIETDTAKGILKKLFTLIEGFQQTAEKLKEVELEAEQGSVVFRYEVVALVPNDIASQFFDAIIRTERSRYLCCLLQRTEKLSDPAEIGIEVQNALEYLARLAVDCKKELNYCGYKTMPEKEASPVHFALYTLKLTLLALYCDVQKSHAPHLEHEDSEQDYFMYVLNDPPPEQPLLTLRDGLEEPGVAEKGKKTDTGERTGFGFIGDKDRLVEVIRELCDKVNMLDERRTEQGALVKVLGAFRFEGSSLPIYLACDTIQFRYIIDKFKAFFDNLRPISVGESQLFYSRNNTLISARNLYASKQVAPKKKEIIDRIFRQMQ